MEEGAAAQGAAAVRTFLIADVRGYTRFTQEQGDEAAAALAASFAEIVEVAIAAHEGDLIELRGDEALVVFSSARQALRAAVAVQRACRQPGADGPGLRLGVGIGLDSGEAVPLAGGGYRGGALNLAARLCSIAKPGQILASEGVVHLARRVEGIRFQPRRAERLKGIDERVRVIEILPDTPLPPVPGIAPPPRGGVRRRTLLVVAFAVATVVAGIVAALFIGSRSARGDSGRFDANSAGFLDDHGRVVGQVPVTGRPAGVAAEESAIWVTDSVNATLLRIDPGRRLAVDRIQVGSSPRGVAIGGGSIWVANSEDGTVSQVDPATDHVVATIRVGNGPTSIAYGSGSVWVLNAIDATTVRIAPGSGRIVARILLSQNPTRLTFGLGAVWVTSEETGVLLRIDPKTNSVAQAIPVGNGPIGVTTGGSAVWVANSPDRTLSRVDPTSGAVTKTALPVRPNEVAYANRSVWISSPLDARVIRVDAGSRQVERTIDIHQAPTALAPANRGLWALALAAPSTHRGGTLRLVLQGGETFDTTDPAVAYRALSWQLLSIVYDGLVAYRRTGGPSGETIVPDLASALPVIQDDGRTYVFQLRKGMRYSDGRPVKAADVRFAIEREYRAGTGLAGLVQIVGGEHCRPRACDLSRGIVTDDRLGTIRFHLREPDPDFLFKLALPFGAVVPRGSPQTNTLKNPLPGTGPYRIQQYVPNRRLVLVRNGHFEQWSADAQPDGYPDRIVYSFGVSQAGATTAVEQGRADVTLDPPPPSRLREIATRFPGLAHPFVVPEVVFGVLDTRQRPFGDVRVRRALNLATDRATLVQLWGGPQLARTTCQVLPPGIAGYRPYCPYTDRPAAAGVWKRPDLPKARRLIAQTGSAGTDVTVAVNADDPVRLAIGRYFVRLLGGLGFSAHLRTYPSPFEFYKAIGKPKSGIQFAIAGWFSDFPRASDFFWTLLRCASYMPAEVVNINAAGFCDHALDTRMSRARMLATGDPAASSALWSRVDREVTDAAPWVPFLNPAGVTITSARVANYQRHPQFGTLLDQLWVR